jgi:fermentation-respiration switch protein FrsA (DUF1100 family)
LWFSPRIRSDSLGWEVALINWEAFLLWYLLLFVGGFIYVRFRPEWLTDKLWWFFLYTFPVFFLTANLFAFRRKQLLARIAWSLALSGGMSCVCSVLVMEIYVFPLAAFPLLLLHFAIGGGV